MAYAIGKGALANFEWTRGENPHNIPDSQGRCVQKALCVLMGWAPGSEEWNSIPPHVAGTDLKRLCEERPDLGLKWHGLDEHISGHTEGIIVGEVFDDQGRWQGHSEYHKEIGWIAEKFPPGHRQGVITRERPEATQT